MKSHIHTGTRINYVRIFRTLTDLQVPGVTGDRDTLTIYVEVPDEISSGAHQDALTVVANAVAE